MKIGTLSKKKLNKFFELKSREKTSYRQMIPIKIQCHRREQYIKDFTIREWTITTIEAQNNNVPNDIRWKDSTK